jgi:hypothetical protein
MGQSQGNPWDCLLIEVGNEDWEMKTGQGSLLIF